MILGTVGLNHIIEPLGCDTEVTGNSKMNKSVNSADPTERRLLMLMAMAIPMLS